MQVKNTAAIMLPHSLLIMFIISVISITLIGTGLNQLKKNQDIDQIEQTLSTIISTAETMAIMAQEGSSIPLKVCIPSSTDFLILGNHTDVYLSVDHTTYEPFQLAHYYGYQTTEGYRKNYYSNVALCNSETHNASILHAGTHDLTLTLQSIHGESYVTITTT